MANYLAENMRSNWLNISEDEDSDLSFADDEDDDEDYEYVYNDHTHDDFDELDVDFDDYWISSLMIIYRFRICQEHNIGYYLIN